jgi:hypothetical protein
MATKRLDDGFSTIISLQNAPGIHLYERDVTPPGITAGGPIETTTMRNTTWRTMSPRALKSLSQVSSTVAYATDAYPVLIAQIGVNQQITVTFPDESYIRFWGWVEEFTPAANTEGEQPTANLVIQPSNHDNNGLEVAPIYSETAATS